MCLYFLYKAYLSTLYLPDSSTELIKNLIKSKIKVNNSFMLIAPQNNK